jgi:hypothetical protein
MDRAEKDPEFKQRIKSQGAKWARLDGVNPSDNTLLDLQGRIAHEEEHAWRLIPSSLQRGWGGSIDESVATGSAIEFRKELNDLDIWDALEKCLAGRVQSESD